MASKGGGSIFQMAGITGGRDEKGVNTFVVPFFCPEGTDPAGDGFPDGPEGSHLGQGMDLKEQSRTWRDNGDGSFTVYITYEGAMETPPQGQGGQWFSGDPGVYELAASLKDLPIEQHPGIAGLMQTYHGAAKPDGSVHFAPGTGSNPNPLFGLRTFKAVSATLRRTIIKQSVSSTELEGVGSVTTKVGQFPTMNYKAPDGKGGEKTVPREWMKLTPTIAKRGGKFTITEEYMMGPKGGFPAYMYSLIQS